MIQSLAHHQARTRQEEEGLVKNWKILSIISFPLVEPLESSGPLWSLPGLELDVQCQ